MLAPQSLRKPANWQDLEMLAKMLFGEIWEDPDIQKNGRNGQQQYGVDIIGMPKGVDGYYGIQCKGKDEYTHQPFTTKDVEKAIAQALHFTPPLVKFYLITTANKNAVIEAFARERNLQHKRRGLFGIQLYCWEDLVDLIDQNPRTYSWYVHQKQFATKSSVVLTFDDDTDKTLCRPKFEKSEETQKPTVVINGNRIPMPKYMNHCVNHGYCPLRIKVKNTGSVPLFDYNIHLLFNGKITGIRDSNVSGGLLAYSNEMTSPINWLSKNSIKILPQYPTIVPGDVFLSAPFYINVPHQEKKLTIEWALLSRDYNQSGTLQVFFEHILVKKDENIITEHLFPDGEEDVEDYCVGW